MSFRLRCLEDAKNPPKPQVSAPAATATPATTATNRPYRAPGVANVAAVAVAADLPYAVSYRDEAAAVRESRRGKVEAELCAHPDQRYAFDVADAPLEAAPGDPVSVVLAIRHGAQLLSGEIHIPRERWGVQALIASLETSPDGPQ